MMKRAIPVLFALLLAGCQTAPPSSETPVLAFDGLPKINLNVARIDVVDNYSAPMQEPHVEHLFRQSPEDVAKKLVAAQLVANGSFNTLRVVIEDASVRRRALAVNQDWQANLTDEPAEEFKARVALRFELVNDSTGAVEGHATVTSDRTRTLLESASVADRDMAFFGIDEAIMNDLKAGLAGTVQKTFGWR